MTDLDHRLTVARLRVFYALGRFWTDEDSKLAAAFLFHLAGLKLARQDAVSKLLRAA